MFNLNNTPLKPSKILLCIYTAGHVCALLALFSAHLETFALLICSLLVCASFAFNLREKVLLSAPLSIVSISWDADDKRMKLQQKNNQILEVEKITQRLSHTYGVYLVLQVPERFFPVTLLVLSDGINQADFRRLRVLVDYAQVEANSN